MSTCMVTNGCSTRSTRDTFGVPLTSAFGTLHLAKEGVAPGLGHIYENPQKRTHKAVSYRARWMIRKKCVLLPVIVIRCRRHARRRVQGYTSKHSSSRSACTRTQRPHECVQQRRNADSSGQPQCRLHKVAAPATSTRRRPRGCRNILWCGRLAGYGVDGWCPNEDPVCAWPWPWP